MVRHNKRRTHLYVRWASKRAAYILNNIFVSEMDGRYALLATRVVNMAGFYCKQVFPLVLGVSQTRAFSILGVTLQEDCRFTTHLRNTLIKANKCLFILRSLRKEGYTQTELD